MNQRGIYKQTPLPLIEVDWRPMPLTDRRLEAEVRMSERIRDYEAGRREFRDRRAQVEVLRPACLN